MIAKFPEKLNILAKKSVNPHTLTDVALADTRFLRINAIHPRAYARGILGVGVNYLAIFALLFSFITPAVAAPTPLTISEIKAVPTDRSATITWHTNRSARGKIEYGTSSGNYNNSVYTNLLRTDQAITVFGLKAETKYYFRITAFDTASEVVSFEQNFETNKATDNQAPGISKVSLVYVTGSTATVQWFTDEPATSEVEYGRTANYGSKKSSSSKVSVHDMTLTSLVPGATYHLLVKSKDNDNNISRWEDITFKTLPTTTAEGEPLVIDLVRPSGENDVNVTITTAVISWHTNKLAQGTVRYGTTIKYGKTITTNPPRDFNHSVTLTNLEPNKTYYFEIQAKDVFGKTIKSEGHSFTTKEGGATQGANTGSGETDIGDQSGQVLGTSYSEITPAVYASYDANTKPEVARGDKTATQTGSLPIVPGKFNKAVNVNAQSQIRYSGPNNFNIKQGTIAFWFKPHWNGGDNNNHVLFDLNPPYAQSGDKYFTIAKTTVEEQGIKNEIAFGLEDNHDYDYWAYIDNVEVLANQWYFVAVTWRYNSSDYKIYLNGNTTRLAYVSNKKPQKNKLGGEPNLGKNFYVGSIGGVKGSVGTDAAIDDLIIFDQVLTDDEIYQLYQEGGNKFKYTQVSGVGDGTTNNDGSILGSYTEYNDDNAGVAVNGAPETPMTPQYACNPNLGYTKFKALYKTADSPDVWAILETGQKHYISSPQAFTKYQCHWSEVKTVSSKTLNSYANANLVRTPQDTTIYHLFQRPEKKWLKINIPSPTVFITYPTNYWGNVARIDALDIDSYPDVKLIKKIGSNEIYLIEGRQKRKFDSLATFYRLDYDMAEVVEINQIHLDSFIDGPAIE